MATPRSHHGGKRHAANDIPAPLPLRQALRVIDTYLDDYIGQSRIAA